jgi:predicted PurR-regulated permease PerM
MHLGSLKPDSADAASNLASWILAGLALFLVLYLHLFPALAAGCLVYQLVQLAVPLIQRRLSGPRSRLVAVGGLAIVTVGIVTLAIFGIVAFLKSETGNLEVLFQKLEHILIEARTKVPASAADYLPGNVDDLKAMASDWVGEHSKEVQMLGKEAMRVFVRMLIGMVIGALISLHEGGPAFFARPFIGALTHRAARFGAAFRNIVFAQIRISAVNTVLTAIFLLVICPLFGFHLPLTKTMIAVTFLAGLLPIIGNLISNTLIVVVALSVSLYGALAALVFLIVIHKLEYFLNARIVGSRIHAHAWELLIAMITLEAAFGVAGLIAAPIYYAYIKSELADAKLI